MLPGKVAGNRREGKNYYSKCPEDAFTSGKRRTSATNFSSNGESLSFRQHRHCPTQHPSNTFADVLADSCKATSSPFSWI
jgi:hypothetical protein